MIEELKFLLSHKIVNGDLNLILKEALLLAIREIKIKKGLVKRTSSIKMPEGSSSMRPQDVKFPGRVKKVPRSILNGIKHSVWQRDQGCCQFRDPVTNKVCGSTFQLEHEHIKPWSFNGEHSIENIAIMCKLCRYRHNLQHDDAFRSILELKSESI